MASTSNKITQRKRNEMKHARKMREQERKKTAKLLAKSHKKWKPGETELFYKRLSQYSTDFSRIAITMNRAPEEIADKYNIEKDTQPHKVSRALSVRIPIEPNPVSFLPKKREKICKQKKRELRAAARIAPYKVELTNILQDQAEGLLDIDDLNEYVSYYARVEEEVRKAGIQADDSDSGAMPSSPWPYSGSTSSQIDAMSPQTDDGMGSRMMSSSPRPGSGSTSVLERGPSTPTKTQRLAFNKNHGMVTASPETNYSTSPLRDYGWDDDVFGEAAPGVSAGNGYPAQPSPSTEVQSLRGKDDISQNGGENEINESEDEDSVAKLPREIVTVSQRQLRPRVPRTYRY